jgi:hypothetical protein
MRRAALLLIMVLPGAVGAQEEEPELSFLEYLGSWEDGDEEWFIVAELEEDLEGQDEVSEDAGDEQDDAGEQDGQ